MGGSRPPRPGAHRSPAAPTGSAPRPPTPSTPPHRERASRRQWSCGCSSWLRRERITAGAPEERRARGEPPSAGRKPSEAAGLPRRFAGRQRRQQHSGECCGQVPAAARSPRRADAHSSHVTPAPSPLHATPSGAPPFARRHPPHLVLHRSNSAPPSRREVRCAESRRCYWYTGTTLMSPTTSPVR